MGLFIFNSSIGRKLVMSITGIALVLFLTFHSIMNIFIVVDQINGSDIYNAICEFLGANWYAIIGTVGLAVLVLIHICYAFWLSLQNYLARGKDRYSIGNRAPGVDWASRNMLILGLIILGFLGLHLFNFWFRMQLPEMTGRASANGSEIVTGLFQMPVYCIFYIIWLSALWLHLTHGVWSAFQTLGWNNHTWLPRIKVISNIYATIVILLFMAIPVYFLITNLLG
jgi:succinate dehydrogenase / fumarate reductase, cytochrome b subunit